eukprot:CAMPEP_0113947774 /NCGR_PEP_ID=MMETSP1339-20121228/66587_1 /TAXON_ID=94617 /ORGANISM="Fibrocapsa japonica" /LENGTH=91 /DNA_ID=CAMNT_0000954499 /DNA_START=54 /DNA_END=329 /DNA_ORIENTATION=- /assembly_acc=CAM_ASM_000762
MEEFRRMSVEVLNDIEKADIAIKLAEDHNLKATMMMESAVTTLQRMVRRRSSLKEETSLVKFQRAVARQINRNAVEKVREMLRAKGMTSEG